MNLPLNNSLEILNDAEMSFLDKLVDSEYLEACFNKHLVKLTNNNSKIYIKSIRVIRYKPSRRCLIEYDIVLDNKNSSNEYFTLIGKSRAKGLDKKTFDVVRNLWENGFGYKNSDSIFVPEPIGLIPEFNMWLQLKVPGVVVTKLLAGPCWNTLAGRIADAIHKLHRTGAPTYRLHTMADELSILHKRLPIVAKMKPQLEKRLERLLDKCARLASATTASRPCGIHRDFYPDQVIVDGNRLYLLDIDQYCEGDPGLDIGNFLGHITELSLRTLGNPESLAQVEKAIEERFVELSGEAMRPRIQAYKTLTLARHIYLSTQFPERHLFTENILELCEQRLSTLDHKYTGKPMHIVSQGKLI